MLKRNVKKEKAPELCLNVCADMLIGSAGTTTGVRQKMTPNALASNHFQYTGAFFL